jgi:hypothetical protein
MGLQKTWAPLFSGPCHAATLALMSSYPEKQTNAV